MRKTLLISLALVLSIQFGWGQSSFKNYQTTGSGLFYNFIKVVKDAPKPAIGDVMSINISYSRKGNVLVKDSVLFSSAIYGKPAKLQLVAPKYKGDVSEGLAMMGIGDSASFIVSADSFFLKNIAQEKVPDFFKPGSKIVIEVSLKAIQLKADFEKEQADKKAKMAALVEDRKSKEPVEIAKFIKDSSITVKPTESGLYYIPVKEGSGAFPKDGDTVKVDYAGRLFNGTIFDASTTRGPVEFVLGAHRVIPGWEEGIKLMKVGGTSKFIIPSKLAYGERGAGKLIEPYTPLYFVVTIISVK